MCSSITLVAVYFLSFWWVEREVLTQVCIGSNAYRSYRVIGGAGRVVQ